MITRGTPILGNPKKQLGWPNHNEISMTVHNDHKSEMWNSCHMMCRFISNDSQRKCFINGLLALEAQYGGLQQLCHIHTYHKTAWVWNTSEHISITHFKNGCSPVNGGRAVHEDNLHFMSHLSAPENSSNEIVFWDTKRLAAGRSSSWRCAIFAHAQTTVGVAKNKSKPLSFGSSFRTRDAASPSKPVLLPASPTRKELTSGTESCKRTRANRLLDSSCGFIALALSRTCATIGVTTFSTSGASSFPSSLQLPTGHCVVESYMIISLAVFGTCATIAVTTFSTSGALSFKIAAAHKTSDSSCGFISLVLSGTCTTITVTTFSFSGASSFNFAAAHKTLHSSCGFIVLALSPTCAAIAGTKSSTSGYSSNFKQMSTAPNHIRESLSIQLTLFNHLLDSTIELAILQLVSGFGQFPWKLPGGQSVIVIHGSIQNLHELFCGYRSHHSCRQLPGFKALNEALPRGLPPLEGALFSLLLPLTFSLLLFITFIGRQVAR